MAVNHLVVGSNPTGGAIFLLKYAYIKIRTIWRDARVVEWNGLENRRGASHPGFESLSLRHLKNYKKYFINLFNKIL
jgi:hypothetical protein